MEYFPNEILIEIFKYFDIQELFQAFYNLNSRFNILLHSLNNLSLTLTKTNYNINKIPIDCISILIINEIQIELDQFTHIRCLILTIPFYRQIHQLSTHTFPYLEHLSINFLTQSFPYNIFNIYNKIFSNEFPCLQSSYLQQAEVIHRFETWTHTLSLRKLKVGKINIFTYKAILSSCSNLYYRKFIKNISKGILLPDKTHVNLKKMIIELPLWNSYTLSEMNNFLSYVPNLEQFSIYHAEFCADINGYLSYDWLSSSINSYLPLLHSFNYYFELFYFGLSNTYDMENILSQIKEHFKKVHNNQYQSRLTIIERI
ncbi:unnamed protein product [Adineta steineri]|uniref:F-box domain-containing protein n=1 Tax=Adineta steineri TaxID=433720 RepID=A0A813V4N8_9BILA|nr:unnamed protein product [Adineta steineri]CAF0943307.1 unnamed protein product [Adineta steineri]